MNRTYRASFWSAPAERSADGALVRYEAIIGQAKAASRSACRRTPQISRASSSAFCHFVPEFSRRLLSGSWQVVKLAKAVKAIRDWSVAFGEGLRIVIPTEWPGDRQPTN